MKNMFAGLIFAVIFFPANQVSAQLQRNYDGTDQLTVNNKTFRVDNFNLIDTTGFEGRIEHQAVFTFGVISSPDFMDFLNAFQDALQKTGTVGVVLSRLSVNGDLAEERSYINASVSWMSFSDLDASSKDRALFTVKITSGNMNVQYDLGHAKNILGMSKSASAIRSNFRMNYGSLPAQKVSGVNHINITSQAEHSLLTLEINGNDGRAWYDYLQSNRMKGKSEQAVVTMLGPDMRAELMKINLQDAEVVSYSENGNDNKAVIGVRAKVSISSK